MSEPPEIPFKPGVIAVDRLRPHPANPRGGDVGQIGELAQSILVHGLLEPLVITPVPDTPGFFYVLAGHRRLAAAKNIDMPKVPVVVRTGKAEVASAIEVMLVENCQRRNLTPVQTAKAMGRLRDGHDMSIMSIAKRTGLSMATVAYHLELLKLDDSTLERIEEGQITAGAGHEAVKATQGQNPNRKPYTKTGSFKAATAAKRAAAWFNATHRLASAAADLCRDAGCKPEDRIGKVACGPHWEAAIAQNAVQPGWVAPASGRVTGHAGTPVFRAAADA